MNTIILTGNLTQDNNYSKTNAGKGFLRNGIAVNMGYYGQDGNWVDNTNFFNIQCFGGVADNIAKNFVKGDSVLIQGEMRAEPYTNKEGQKQIYHYVNVTRIERSIKKKPDAATQGTSYNGAPAGIATGAPVQQGAPAQQGMPAQQPVQQTAPVQPGTPVQATGEDFNPFDEGLPFK